MKEIDEENKYFRILNTLFYKALEKMPFDTLCTVLRVGGVSDANWDPFEESRDALDDFNWILEISGKERSERCQTRVALLMYCQLVEMTAPHEILINLLRCIHGDGYSVVPFFHLEKRGKKRKPFSCVPASANAKFKYICDKAAEYKEDELVSAIKAFFSDEIRNAFSHSDYIITDKHFRFTGELELEELGRIINECFKFYSAFIPLHHRWLYRLSQLRKYHKWPRYEVLELLSDENGVYGFNVHFSNGSKSTYSRRPTGIVAMNIFCEENGVGFMVGDIDAREPVWKVDGVPVEDWDALEEKGHV